MKTITKITTVAVASLLLLGAAAPKAQAGDREWATVGKILTGFVAAGVVLSQIDNDRAYTSTSVTHSYGRPSYCPPTPPPPVWAPAHYETRCEQVWVEGYYRLVETPAVYGWERHGGYGRHGPDRAQIMIRPGCVERIWVPGHYESREVRVYVPGCYVQNGY